jgi:alpha-tubulin suppressor-like RCC1 family protein
VASSFLSILLILLLALLLLSLTKQQSLADPTTTTLRSDANPSTLGAPVTFTAMVEGDFVSVPSGTVDFYDGKVRLGADTLGGIKLRVTAGSIFAGYWQTCALASIGGLQCWGYNQFAQLGDRTTTNRTTPVDVRILTTEVRAVALGTYHTCALTRVLRSSTDEVLCWGYNLFGELGAGFVGGPGEAPITYPWHTTPLGVPGLTSGVSAITAGNRHTCALTGGAVKCWGDDSDGQLGDGGAVPPPRRRPGDSPTAFATSPVNVTGLKGVEVHAIEAGASHTCALTRDGEVKCWGSDLLGQLGDGGAAPDYSTRTIQTMPTNVAGLKGVRAIAAGGGHTCALTSEGRVKCWGHNYYGQLGAEAVFASNTPVDVRGLDGVVVTDLAAGSVHTCALTRDGEVKCWGGNDSGQVGDGTTIQRSHAVAVRGLGKGVRAIAAGGGHTCALTTARAVKCWGQNNAGSLGDGSTTNRTWPVDVRGLISGPVATATFTTSSLAAGTHNISAVYSGDPGFASSTSGVLIQEVTSR